MAASLGMDVVPARVEALRSKAKRLVARGWLAEPAPGRFTLARVCRAPLTQVMRPLAHACAERYAFSRRSEPFTLVMRPGASGARTGARMRSAARSEPLRVGQRPSNTAGVHPFVILADAERAGLGTHEWGLA